MDHTCEICRELVLRIFPKSVFCNLSKIIQFFYQVANCVTAVEKVKFLKFRKWLKIYNRAISISVNDAGLSYRSIFYTPLFAVDVISHKSYSNRYYILNIYLNLVAQFTNSADFESFCIWSRIKICSWYGNC